MLRDLVAASLTALLLVAARDVNGAHVVANRVDDSGDVRIERRTASESHKCDDGVLAYFAGGEKEHVISIPYPTECVADVIRQGRHKLLLPPSASFSLKGLPKTGTPWTEVIAKHILKEVCLSGLYPGCAERGCEVEEQAGEKMNKGRPACQLAFPSPGHKSTSSRVEFSVARKHLPDFKGVDCSGFPDQKAECTNLQENDMSSLPSMWNQQPEWMGQCMPSMDSYSALKSCIPSFLNGSNIHRIESSGHVPIKYLFVMRDPRDAAVSWAHHRKGIEDHDTATLNKLLAQKQTCTKYSIWTAFFYYWHVEHLSSTFPTLELWYSNMTEKPEQEVLRIMEFFGIRATTEIVQKVVDRTSFHAMHGMEERGELPGHNSAGSAKRKVRKGPSESFEDEMSRGVAKECAEAMRAYLPELHQDAFHVPYRVVDYFRLLQ